MYLGRGGFGGGGSSRQDGFESNYSSNRQPPRGGGYRDGPRDNRDFAPDSYDRRGGRSDDRETGYGRRNDYTQSQRKQDGGAVEPEFAEPSAGEILFTSCILLRFPALLVAM